MVEGEAIAWQVDLEGRDNLQAPSFTSYIATLHYHFK